MNKFKVVLTVALAVMISVSAVWAVTMSVDELKQLQGTEQSFGAFPGPEIYQDLTVYGTIKSQEPMTSLAKTSIYATTTLTVADSGTTYSLSASGTTIILPKATKGVTFKFVVGAETISDGNYIVLSAETANIYGVILTGGVDYACATEDAINFIADGEKIGDFVEIYSDGTNWFIGSNGATTDAKITCTT